MPFLPIVDRELRVAARKPNTFWLRTIAGVVGLLIAAACLMLSLAQGVGTVRMGDVLFNVLTWLALGGALSAGLFFSSDCLSEEKREGTIGFLFLTDLRGYDVVSGKLLATSLRAFYGLLAVLPILGVTLLMGGVTGDRFFKTSLALFNALVCSLAAGVFVSSVSRDAQKAMAGTLLLLFLLSGGGPVIDLMIAKFNSLGLVFSVTSPVYAFILANAWGKTQFWTAISISHAIGWLLFTLACILVPRTWQLKARGFSLQGSPRTYAWKYGATTRRGKTRQKLLAKNPILWLACRERWQALGIWLLALLVLGGVVVVLASGLPREVWLAWTSLNHILCLLLYLGAATQACRFFIDARRSGLLELLLATPLNDRHIVHGQARAMLRMFGWPVLLLLMVQIGGVWLSHGSWKNVSMQLGGNAPGVWTVLLTGLVSLITIAANLIAICCFGMWMGMTSKTINLATFKTLLFVQIIPWMVIAFGSSSMAALLILIPRLIKPGAIGGPQMMVWFPLITSSLAGILALGKDVGFFFWARNRLYHSLREQATRSLAHTRVASAPPRSPPVLPPPVIPVPS